MTRFATVALLLYSVLTAASDGDGNELLFQADAIVSERWSVSGIQSVLELSAQGLRGEIGIRRITLRDSGKVFTDTVVRCGRVVLTSRDTRCEAASIAADFPGIGRQTVSGTLLYDRYTGAARIELPAVAVAGGSASIEIDAGEDGVTVQFRGRRLHLDEMLALAATFNDTLAEYTAGGMADVEGSYTAMTAVAPAIVVNAILDGASLANAAGTVAADNVAGTLEIALSLGDERAEFDLRFSSNQGEAYLEPVYADFSKHAFRLQADDVATSDFSVFEIPAFVVQQDELLDAAGSASLAFPADKETPVGISADVTLRDSAVANLYSSFVQVRLAGTVFGSLETDGRLSGAIKIVNSAPESIALQLDDLILDDRQGRFAIYGLKGFVDWRAEAASVPDISRLSWDSGSVYSIAVGGGDVELQLGDNDFALLAPLRLTMMGGALMINQLTMHDFGSDDARGTLDAELEPVQMGQLTGAFGWPAFSGALSGRLPLLQLAENTITVGGTLSARAFDGSIEMSRLRIEQPFGRVPRLQGEIAFRNLNLERVTDTFSFGLIQGRLSGDIAGLKMQNWRPVEMDMHFYTPPDDKSRHRISQRAVENLASVGGGGAAAALSSGFLQFFEVFAYDRIGLRCVLRDGVCRMSGAGPASGGSEGKGYYIVRGRGLPRIDVVGYRDTVSWQRLVDQLAAITRSGSPTVN